MDTTGIKVNWNEQKGKLRKKLTILTEKCQMFAEGKKDEISEKLKIEFGKTKKELCKIVE